MTLPLLEVKNLNLSLSKEGHSYHILRDISFAINPGEIVGLVGESGCGKSMTASAIPGLLPPSKTISGRIDFEGENLLQLSPRRLASMRGNRISLILQDPSLSLNPLMTIGQQLTEGLRYHKKIDKKKATKIGIEWLTRVGISDPEVRMKQYPHEFSGGMKQRILIAAALICKPSLVIADEPTTALDATIQEQILNLLQYLQDEERMSLLLITHDLGVVARLCQRVMVMYAGQLVEMGPVDQVLKSPQHPYTQALLQSRNSLANIQSAPLTSVPLLDVRQISRHYSLKGSRICAVDNVSFRINRGEVLGIGGESGCGKTTVGKLCMGLESPTSGSIYFNGTDLFSLLRQKNQSWRRNLQMIFQHPAGSLNPCLTIEKILAEPLIIHGTAKGERLHKHLIDLLAQVGLPEHFLKRMPHELSGGQKQRIAIARALAMEPELLICDEPFAGLDVSVQAQIVNLLAKLHARLNLSYLIISHDLLILRYLAHRLAIMYLGQMIEYGTSGDIYENPLHPYTQALISAVLLPVPELEKRRPPYSNKRRSSESDQSCKGMSLLFTMSLCAKNMRGSQTQAERSQTSSLCRLPSLRVTI